MAFDLTGGEKGDAPHFPIPLGLGPAIDPRAALGDKEYSSKANRKAARHRGIVPVIPHKTNERDKPAFFAKTSIKAEPASRSRSARSSASHYAARRQSETSQPSSHSQPLSS
ncbi:hypothetical protein [Mesorhizobium cantuariense]|uniref:Transposase IS4-like domain-containing protein n=1 Tax=Mesorhizobium cantuariense TaxID=1300275 RepID=A0ABV7MQH7_9HYPH